MGIGFTFLDVLLLIILVGYLISGVSRGFFVCLGTLGGFVLGVIAAFTLTPWVISQVGDGWYVIAAVISVVMCILVGQWIGFLVGRAIRRFSDATPLRNLERVAGGVLNIVVAVLMIVATTLMVRPLGIAQVTTALNESAVVNTLLHLTPDPVEEKITSMRAQVLDSGVIPEVQDLLFPSQEPPAQPLSNPALQNSSESVVQVLGAAEACSYTSEGSGFVIGQDLIATNAHVVAGVSQPMMLDRSGKMHSTKVVFFDQTHDIAFLAAQEDLPLSPLIVGEDVAAGTEVSFMGYPGGGPFENRPALVQGLGYTRTINSETGETNPTRLVYQLAADVQQGNSGGPVLNQDGLLVGMVFAKATQGETGYAIPVQVISDALVQLGDSREAVASGACIQHTSSGVSN